MVDMNFGAFWAVTIHAAIALLHPVWISGNFIMDESRAVILEIDTLKGATTSTDGRLQSTASTLKQTFLQSTAEECFQSPVDQGAE
jgi:hypothetical protein